MPELTDPQVTETARELVPLRDVVREAVLERPVVLTELGIDDLVSRITVAVAAYIGREVVPPQARTAQVRPVKLAPDEPCPGCGALPKARKHGRSREHSPRCDYVGDFAPAI